MATIINRSQNPVCFVYIKSQFLSNATVKSWSINIILKLEVFPTRITKHLELYIGETVTTVIWRVIPFKINLTNSVLCFKLWLTNSVLCFKLWLTNSVLCFKLWLTNSVLCFKLWLTNSVLCFKLWLTNSVLCFKLWLTNSVLCFKLWLTNCVVQIPFSRVLYPVSHSSWSRYETWE